MLGDSKLQGGTPWASFLAKAREDWPARAAEIRPSDPAMMMFTSGTTGRPKGVLLDHAGLRLCHDRARIMGLGKDDVQLTYLPLFHIYAIGYSVIMSFIAGASQVLMQFFNGEQALRLIQEHRITALHGFEAHFADLLAAQEKLQLDISSLRIASFATGAESVRALAERVQTELCPTSASYGLTEMWGGLTITGPGATLSQRCEASGLPQPGIEIRIVDVDSGEVLPPGVVGEIQVRSYARLIGYYEDPVATAAALDQDGWFRTGDAGLLREDGHLRYFTRYKDMLKVGGENVAPAEIEELICKLPGVRAAAVVGQKSERLQEVPVAFVVASGTDGATEESILDFMRDKIARFKLPARVVFVDELPMTSTGKVQKELLRQRLRQESA
jgi:fatty-acyl-CoA synthase